MTRPWWSTVIRWEMEKTTSMSCSVKRSVSFRSRAMRSMRRIESRVSVADIPAVGSSSSRISGSSASAMPSSSCFWSPWERKPDTSPAWPTRPIDSSSASVSARYSAPTGVSKFHPRPRCDRKAAWTFWYTVRRGKMLVRWNERPMPSRQRSWGAMPVTSCPRKRTRPASGRRWPVMRLNSVVLPAPFGPMIALMEPAGTVKLTPPTAMKPSKLFLTSRTSSMATAPGEAARQAEGGAGQAPGKREQQHDQDAAEDQRPVLGVGHDLLVEPDQDERADRGAGERAHAAEQRHDQHLGRLGPVREVREHAAVEDAEERPGDPGEGARDDERRQLVAPHVHADELRTLRVLADRGEHAPERRAHDAPEEPEADGDHEHREEVEVVGRAVAADQRQRPDPAVDRAEIGVGDLRHALLAARHLVPLEADGPDDLREGERQHREVDAGQAHAEEAEHQRGEPGHDGGRGQRDHERRAHLLHEDAGGVGADAEVRGVAEGDEARVSHEEVEAGREECPDHHVVREERVEARAERRYGERRDQGQPPPWDPRDHGAAALLVT